MPATKQRARPETDRDDSYIGPDFEDCDPHAPDPEDERRADLSAGCRLLINVAADYVLPKDWAAIIEAGLHLECEAESRSWARHRWSRRAILVPLKTCRIRP